MEANRGWPRTGRKGVRGRRFLAGGSWLLREGRRMGQGLSGGYPRTQAPLPRRKMRRGRESAPRRPSTTPDEREARMQQLALREWTAGRACEIAQGDCVRMVGRMVPNGKIERMRRRGSPASGLKLPQRSDNIIHDARLNARSQTEFHRRAQRDY
ncbi:hypothetical protein T484DRAFT_3054184 [Baffinella frigidus]|nr:hypothetical protein T484DRAFT_3054184 [Cryptophyta sp. CCMP2293]